MSSLAVNPNNRQQTVFSSLPCTLTTPSPSLLLLQLHELQSVLLLATRLPVPAAAANHDDEG